MKGNNDEYIPSISEQAEARWGKARGDARPTGLDRLPPHSNEAEQGVLGCLLWDPNVCVPECQARLKDCPDWAYDHRHLAIYEHIVALHRELRPVELNSVQQRLRDHGLLDQVGDIAYLSSLQDSVPSAANLSYYLDIVFEKWVRRSYIRELTAGVGAAYESEAEDVRGLIRTTLSKLDVLLDGGAVQRERHIRHIIPNVIDELQEYHRGRTQLRGLSTGFSYLDKLFQGIAPTHYIVLAGRPGDGKSSLAMNMVEYLALRHRWWDPTTQAEVDAGKFHTRKNGIDYAPRTALGDDNILRVERVGQIPTCIFSLEMDGESLVERMMFGNGRVSMGTWNTGMAGAKDFEALGAASGRLAKAPIWIDDVSDQTIEQIESRARRMIQEHGIKLFVLDYIQLLDTEDEKLRADRVRELTKISKAIVRMKKRLKVPWIVLAQMNRNIEQSESKRVPILSDLKDCGALEQDADKVGLLYRPSVKEREADEELLDRHYADVTDWSAKPALVNLMVAKNRRGPTGPCKMLFFRNQTRFKDLREWKLAHQYEHPAAGEKRPEIDDFAEIDAELQAQQAQQVAEATEGQA